MHYTVWPGSETGRARPVLLLHGFTEAVFVWEELAAFLLDRGYDVYCLDLAGHGKTDMFGEVHGMELQASLAKHVLDAEGIGKAVVIGHSMGGYVAAAFVGDSACRAYKLYHRYHAHAVCSRHGENVCAADRTLEGECQSHGSAGHRRRPAGNAGA